MATTDVQLMHVELWSDDNAVRLDAQSIAFFKDVGFQLQDIIDATLEDVPNYVPRYLGKYLDSLPDLYRFGDWFLIYGIDDNPFTRGVHRVNKNLSLSRLDGDSGADASCMSAALSDILDVTNMGFGILSDYGAITFIANLATHSIFTQSIQIGSGQITGLGSLATEESVELSKLGSTIIQGGFLKTSLLDIDTILGVNAVFTGIMQAAKGLFSGSIASGPLELNIEPPADASLTTGGKLVSAFIAELISSGILAGSYNCSGIYNGSLVERVSFSIGGPVIVSSETATSMDYTQTSSKLVPVGKDIYGNTIYWTACYWSRVTSTWKRNRTERLNQITFRQNGTDVVVGGKTSPSETWQFLSSASDSGWSYHLTPADTPAPTGWTNAQDTTPALAIGTISFVKTAFSMKLVNLPAYSGSLPSWTVYLQSDGAGNYDLKVKG